MTKSKFEFLWSTFGMHRHIFEEKNDKDGGTVRCMKGDFDYWLSDSGEWVYYEAC